MKIPALLLASLLPALAAGTPGRPAPDARYFLIAHRGGVVEDKYPDNRPASLQAAVTRGYRMLEVDIRETKDGVLVMRHDPDWQLDYGEPRQVIDLTWEETRRLRTTPAGWQPWRFEDLVPAARAAGLRLMLDSKAPHSAEFPAKVEAILRRHGMLESCYVIGTGDVMERLTGKALVGKKFRALQALAATDPAAKDRYFLFDHGSLTAEQVQWAQARGFRIVASINLYHYYDARTMAGKSRDELAPVILAAAKADIEKLKALGVTEFQIDSEFDAWF